MRGGSAMRFVGLLVPSVQAEINNIITDDRASKLVPFSILIPLGSFPVEI
jgi:hypothetical protein